MPLIVGLGNPGSRYSGTRHNVGFMVADELGRQHGFPPMRSEGRALVTSGEIGGQRVLLAKPVTYMNLSGEAVCELVRRHCLHPADVWVVVDDASLPLGTVRMRLKGSAGGHRGLASIEEHLGTQEYPRVRLGIGASEEGDLVQHVLSRFHPQELETVRRMIVWAAEALTCAVTQGFEAAMSRYNGPLPKVEDPQSER